VEAAASKWCQRVVHLRQAEQGQGRGSGQGGRAIPADRLVADGAGVAQKNLSWSEARELRKLFDHDHPELSISRQCVLLGLPRSTLYYRPLLVRQSTLRIIARISGLYMRDHL
jgi:hypothetical protein